MLDNIFVERLWRSLKYKCAYLHAWETGSEAKAGVTKWMDFYNHKRPHSALGAKPPVVIYWRRTEATQPDQQVQRVAHSTPEPVQLLRSSSLDILQIAQTAMKKLG
ncbi:MAG: transposase [Aestuariivita sp.]|nr:transposase [Aestuariivita sp.]